MTRLEEIEARLNAATPGDWVHKHGTITLHKNVSVVKERDSFDWLCCMQISNQPNAENDGIFIANSPADMAFLLARVKALEAVAHLARRMDGYLVDLNGECGNSDVVWMRRLLAALDANELENKA